MKLSKWIYYSRSMITLLTRFKHPAKTVRMFSGAFKDYPTKIELRRSDLQFWVRSPMDMWVVKETCVDRDYLNQIGQIHTDWNVIDIGAGIGDFTILASKQASNGVVHAYEPFDESVTLLQKNIVLNDSQNVVSYAEAVASKNGRMILEEDDSEAVSKKFVMDASKLGQAVDAVSLEQRIQQLPAQKCDFLKIDCEGGEFDIILNSPVSCFDKIDRIGLEYHDGFTEHSHEDIIDFLERVGFQVLQEDNPVHDNLGFLYAQRDGLA